MAQNIDKVYQDAIASRLLPGVSVIAGDRDGNVLYAKSFGRASLKEGRDDAFTASTICAIASMSKLMTSVAVLQCVEQGRMDLDKDIRSWFPGMGQHGIITAFDDERNAASLEPDATPITLRMLLSHTSGHEYDWLNPRLSKWRASRNEVPWSGPRVEDKSALPLVFRPGTGFAYGAVYDWAGKATKPGMKDRMADMSTLSEQGEPPAVDAPTFDILFGCTDCLGGGGLVASASAYYTFLSAVFRRDPKLLSQESYAELFRPQLNETLEQAFNDYFARSPKHTQFLALGIPHSIRKTWSFAGVVCLGGQEGRFEKGTTFWAGVPSVEWFMDHEAGICGTALCQILPPMHPAVIGLHEKVQREVLGMVKRK